MMKVFIPVLILLMTVKTGDAGTSRLSVQDVVRIAANGSNPVRAAGFYATAAQSAVAVAGSRYLPNISFEETFAASNSPTQTFMMKLDQGRFTQNDFQTGRLNNPGTQQDFKTALTLVQPLFDRSVSYAREIAVKNADVKAFSLESTRQETAFTAFRLYLEMQKAKAKIVAVEAALKEAQESLRLAGVQARAGTGLRSDELRARTNLAAIEQSLYSAKNRLVLVRMQLENLLGFKEGDTLEIEDTVIAITPELSMEELIRTALEGRSDLMESKSMLERSDIEAKLAGSSYFPSLVAFAGYQLNSKNIPFSSDRDSWAAGVTLKWQLFDGFGRYNEYARAAANRSANAQLHDTKVKELVYNVRESLLMREEAGKRLEVARYALRDAEETVRLLSRRYENSLATMFELLDAQTVLNQVRSGLIDSEANYVLSGGQVYHAAGIFLKEMLK